MLNRKWKIRVFTAWLISIASVARGLTVAVFGGSGFVGRRICKTLIGAGCEVVSLSRSGKPSSQYCDSAWSDLVNWISFDVDKDCQNNPLVLGDYNIDAAISCVGNVQPRREFTQLFGLAFNSDKLRHENGELNKRICNIAKDAGAEKFVFLSVSYETAKALEGPIEGYLDGKRQAEKAAFTLFGSDDTVVLGPSLIYGGKRFNKFGRIYKTIVRSPIAKAYVRGNDMLRNVSVAPLEDWVEKMVFSPPIEVQTVARVATAAAIGLVTRPMVGPRKQGFFDSNGQPVLYDDMIFVDGTDEIERIDKLIDLPAAPYRDLTRTHLPNKVLTESRALVEDKVPPFEGALVGKLPFLYPLPVVATFIFLFWCVATQQFVQLTELNS